VVAFDGVEPKGFVAGVPDEDPPEGAPKRLLEPLLPKLKPCDMMEVGCWISFVWIRWIFARINDS
jgi:hypothetical protein